MPPPVPGKADQRAFDFRPWTPAARSALAARIRTECSRRGDPPRGRPLFLSPVGESDVFESDAGAAKEFGARFGEASLGRDGDTEVHACAPFNRSSAIR